MKLLPEDRLDKLAELLFTCVSSPLWNTPGAEYEALRRFFNDAGLSPPILEISSYGYRDRNIRNTKEWLLSYLTELNSRATQGRFFPAGIERIIHAMLSLPDRHRIAAEFERLFDPIGVGVSFDRTQDAYALSPIELGSSNEPRKSVPVILYEHLGLHSRLYEASRHLFENGHFAQATFEASKVLEQVLKERLAGNPRAAGQSGTSLVNLAFSEQQPLLRINRLRTQTDKDEHNGIRFLLAGTLMAIRNPLAHEDIRLDPYEALEKLVLISLLVKRIETAEDVHIEK